MNEKDFMEFLFKSFYEDEKVGLSRKKNIVSIKTTKLSWGPDYINETGIQTTTHTAVSVNGKIVNYDYKNVKELLKVLDCLEDVEIFYDGKPLN